jgi:hypothetical protein
MTSRRWLAGAAAGVVLCALAGAVSRAAAVDYGRVSGTVSDSEGNPLMGATVMLTGPRLAATETLTSIIERVTTDSRGNFSIEHLVPGWYTLRVVSATRVPAMRDKIRVAAGETTRQKFVLDDFFSPLHLQKAKVDFSSWGDDWKWILRTSDATRPVLRFRRTEQASNGQKPLLPAGERVAGVTPGSMSGDTLSEDPGMASVVAYLKPLSRESDLLVAGSMGSLGLEDSAFVTSFRKGLTSGNPEELSLVVHNLNFAPGGMPVATSENGDPLTSAQSMVISFVRTQRLSKSLTVTTGLEANYLRANDGAEVLNPRLEADYQLSRTTKVVFNYGDPASGDGGSVMERVGTMDRFPRVSLRGSRLQLESVRHVEVAIQRQIGRSSRVEFATYRDSFRNTAVWGLGNPSDWAGQGALPNGEGNGLTVNGGNYASKGFRGEYERHFGDYVEVSVAYANGDALAPAKGMENLDETRSLEDSQIAKYLRPQRTEMVAGQISARIPSCHTQIITSYTWLPSGRVTVVDPYDLANMDLGPFLGIQIRQPLPSVAFLPAHFEALADFRNLLGQGSVAMAESDGNPVVLTSAYRTLRGGFAVRF